MNNKDVNNKEMKNLIKKSRALAKPFCITDDRFRLEAVYGVKPDCSCGVHLRVAVMRTVKSPEEA